MTSYNETLTSRGGEEGSPARGGRSHAHAQGVRVGHGWAATKGEQQHNKQQILATTQYRVSGHLLRSQLLLGYTRAAAHQRRTPKRQSRTFSSLRQEQPQATQTTRYKAPHQKLKSLLLTKFLHVPQHFDLSQRLSNNSACAHMSDLFLQARALYD
jgi:hypothetical protein